MNELDPNYLLPLWRAVVTYFSRYRPLVQGDQQLNPRASDRVAAVPAPAVQSPARRFHKGAKTGLVNI